MSIPPKHRIDAVIPTPGHAPPPMRRFFIDCTKTYFFGGSTGIQRVVTECAAHAEAAGQDVGVRCVPVVWAGTGFIELGGNRVEAPFLSRLLCTGLRRMFVHLRRVGKQWFPRRASMRTVEKVDPPRTHTLPSPNLATALAAGAMYFVLSWLALPGSWLRFRFPRFHANDVLILPDANWGNLIPTNVLEEVQQFGTKLVCVMHDILPVRIPETFEAELVARFDAWLKWACRHVDAMVCVSHSTQTDLQNYFAEQFLANPPCLGTFRLGCNPRLDKAGPRPQIVQELELIGRRPWLLCVGTLEPRKNHDLLLDACERLWDSGRLFGLVFVGRIGWRSERLINRIAQHPHLRHWLHVYHDLSDSELDLAYEGATGVVMPSLAEGLGLPVIEALMHNKPVIASDIPPHRETGQDHCLFFAPDDETELCDRISKLLDGQHQRPMPANEDMRLPDWNTSVRELLQEVDRLLPHEHDRTVPNHVLTTKFGKHRDRNIARGPKEVSSAHTPCLQPSGGKPERPNQKVA